MKPRRIHRRRPLGRMHFDRFVTRVMKRLRMFDDGGPRPAGTPSDRASATATAIGQLRALEARAAH
jgi:hypothetical protein